MSVTHTSAHHSPDDPGGLIREAFNMGAEFPGPAQDLLLAWLLSLGNEIDPAQAARRLIVAYDIENTPPPAGPCGELAALLRQTAETDSQQLTAGRRRKRRRN